MDQKPKWILFPPHSPLVDQKNTNYSEYNMIFLGSVSFSGRESQPQLAIAQVGGRDE